jgi:GT2 family glycosyltransferase
VLVRSGGVPVGRLQLPDGISTTALANAIPAAVADAALRAGLAALLGTGLPRERITVADALDAGRSAPASPVDGPTITVAICTKDRVQQLERALASVVPSLGPRDELLVVDNASRDDAVARLVRQRFPAARFVREERRGLGWARNRAIIESRSDVIAFCDDDCVMEPGTLTALRAVLARNPDVDAVTGLVEPLALGGESDRLFDLYFASDRRYRRRWVHAPRSASVARHVGNTGLYGTGASLAIRRDVFDRVGVFDAALGPGTPCGAGDDMEFLFRMLKRGGMLVCEPRTSVRHEHRADISELEEQVESWSRGFACAVERSKLAYPEERVPYSILMARIALLYHARRAATQPAIRRLALAELRGIAGAGNRYADSRRAAESIARSVSSPATDARPDEPCRHNGSAPSATSTMTLDLGASREPLEVGAGVALLTLDVRGGGQSLGRLNVTPSRKGVVGTDRLVDAVIDNLAPALMVRRWEEAVNESRSLLQENLLKVPRDQ